MLSSAWHVEWCMLVLAQKSTHVLLPSKLENCDEEVMNGSEPQTITAVPAPCDIAIVAVQESITGSWESVA